MVCLPHHELSFFINEYTSITIIKTNIIDSRMERQISRDIHHEQLKKEKKKEKSYVQQLH